MNRLYLDYNATTPVDPRVEAFITTHLSVFGNPSSLHKTGRESKELLENAREQIAASIRAQYDQLIFTSSGSEGNNQVLHSVFFDALITKKPQHIILSHVEHSSVRVCAERLKSFGIDISYLPVTPTGIVNLEALPSLMTPHTALISVMLANNETGAIQPIKDIVSLTKNHPCLVHTDAVQAFGKMPIDVQALGVDFLTLSSHKVYAPKGSGILFAKDTHRLHALIAGASHEKELRAGTENVLLNAAFGFATTLFEPDFNRAHFAQLYDAFFKAITAHCPRCVFHSTLSTGLANTICVSFPGHDGQSIAMNCDLEGIDISTGSACSSGSIEPSLVLKSMGTSEALNTSTVRISLGRSTTLSDIQRLVASLKLFV